MIFRINSRKKVFIILFLLFQIAAWLGGHCSLTRKKISLLKAEEEATFLKEANLSLKKEIALYSSLLAVREKVIRRGLVKEDRVVVLAPEKTFAFKD